jgi:transposase
MYSLMVKAKLNEGDPLAWLADVLQRIADHPVSGGNELLPWHRPRPIEDGSFAA